MHLLFWERVTSSTVNHSFLPIPLLHMLSLSLSLSFPPSLHSSVRPEEALADCIWAQKYMRENAVIDYRQLGLRYKLYSWQVQ